MSGGPNDKAIAYFKGLVAPVVKQIAGQPVTFTPPTVANVDKVMPLLMAMMAVDVNKAKDAQGDKQAELGIMEKVLRQLPPGVLGTAIEACTGIPPEAIPLPLMAEFIMPLLEALAKVKE